MVAEGAEQPLRRSSASAATWLSQAHHTMPLRRSTSVRLSQMSRRLLSPLLSNAPVGEIRRGVLAGQKCGQGRVEPPTFRFQKNARVHESPPQSARAGQMTCSGSSASRIDLTCPQPLLAQR